jgi:hypothetical protein
MTGAPLRAWAVALSTVGGQAVQWARPEPTVAGLSRTAVAPAATRAARPAGPPRPCLPDHERSQMRMAAAVTVPRKT